MSTECQLSVEQQSGEVSRQAREGHKGELINRRTLGTVPEGVGKSYQVSAAVPRDRWRNPGLFEGCK